LGTLIQDLGIFTGQAIVQRICHEVMNLVPDPEEDKGEWFKKADGTIQLSNEMVEGFELLRAAGLAIVQDTWDELPLPLRADFGYQFRVYAEKRCPTLQWSTIDNHIRAARTFILDGAKPAGKVEVILRNQDKTPMLKDGVVQTEYVEFDPLKVPISKLVLVRNAVESGKIDNNPALWSKVLDDFYTWQEVRSELFSPASKEAKIDPEIKFTLLGPVLIAEQHFQEVVLIDDEGIKWEVYYDKDHKDHELVKAALDRLFLLLNVKPDADILSAILSKRLVAQQQREERRLR
jgi:hypothetical protein